VIEYGLTALLLLALLLGACGPATPTTSEPAEPAPTETASPTDEALPAIGVPDGWQMHTSSQWAVSFAVPTAWQEVGMDRFEGKAEFSISLGERY
jgi:hypothetical protein